MGVGGFPLGAARGCTFGASCGQYSELRAASTHGASGGELEPETSILLIQTFSS